MPRDRAFAALAALIATCACAGLAAAARADAGTPVVVAVVDTGVDTSLGALAGRVVAGFAVDGLGASTSDGGWHGTAIASIVASVDPRATVMPVKTLDGAGHGGDEQIAQGVVWAVEHGAKVVNLSLEGPTEAPSLHAALRYAAGHGVVVVAAAGNHGTSQRTYPAADPYAIGVAGVQASGALYDWSNRGRWVAVAAPGINASVVPGGGAFGFAGTSSSSADVSGVVALCLEAAPTLSPAAVRRIVVSTATRLPKEPFGRVDGARVVEACSRASGR